MTESWPKNFHQVTHNLVIHKLSYLRQHAGIIDFQHFEALIEELGTILAYEATKDALDLKPITHRIDESGNTVPKPVISIGNNELEWRPGQSIANKPVLIPTIRSGMVLANAMRKLLSTPYMGHLALVNDEQGNPFEYLVILPEEISGSQHKERTFILVDFCIDRGRTAKRAIEVLQENKIENHKIRFVTLIITPEGRDELKKLSGFGQIEFFCARFDDEKGGPDRWIDDLHKFNHRLFRTRNHND